MLAVHLVLPSALHPALRGEASAAVRFGFDAVVGPAARRVEVHVKAARPRRRWRVVGGRSPHTYARRRDAVEHADLHGGSVEARDVAGQQWTTGRAYDGVPGLARVAGGVHYLVTLKIPVDRAGVPPGRYPRTWQYAAYRTAPAATFASWVEELLHAAAHEARHVWQFATGAPRSEVDAERVACAVLGDWRAARGAGEQLRLF
jgi:hypothetical protein